MLLFSRSFESLPVTFRVGGGLVLAHTDSIVRGTQSTDEGGLFGTGYELTGPVLMGGVGKDFNLSPRFFVALELQATFGWANVSVYEGDASTTNLALHWMVGAAEGTTVCLDNFRAKNLRIIPARLKTCPL
jgi:hypothetical protein